MDFGQGAWVMVDGKRKRPHFFRIVLSHSRKGYSEVVWQQNTENFIRCLENAFSAFGGVPQTIVVGKGKAEALTIYEPIGMETHVEKKVLDELKLWHQTLRQYRFRQWDQVEVGLLNLQRMNPGCALYELYAKEVADKRRNPPAPTWDGVTVFDEK